MLRSIIGLSALVLLLSAFYPTFVAGQMVPLPHQLDAVKGLLKRRFSKIEQFINVEYIQCCSKGHAACFEVESDGKSVTVRGTAGTEIAAGLHWFLKFACNSSISWDNTGGDTIDLSCFEPESLQQLKEKGPLHRSRTVPWHYYQNVVTPSYSMAYWSWARWEQEIDWMALQGINLPLAFSGQEYVWQKVWARFNISAADLESFFAGPSFLAWNRMGNLQGYGGPLPQNYIDSQAELQRKIVARMRAFGMTPVFPAFAGFVPEALARERPDARITRSANWCNFPAQFCCVPLLDPLDPLFQSIGSTFVQVLRDEFGSDSVGFYSADTFNEMAPPTDDPAYLRSITEAIYKAMAAADPSAKWLMQAWMFYDDQVFWQPPQIQALVSGVPKGSLVLLDLYAEVFPIWKRTQSFYGAPYIYCMLHNFGGNVEMYGAFAALSSGPAEAMAGSAGAAQSDATGIIGVGMCPEGIEQNPVAYDLMGEWAFRRHSIEMESWIESYARRRYGKGMPPSAIVAWKKLLHSVYNATDAHTDHNRDIVISRPGLVAAEIGLWGLRPHLWYDEQEVLDAWGLLLHSADYLGSVEAFCYDLVDVGRQVMSKRATDIWKAIVEAYQWGRSLVVQSEGARLLQLLDDLDELLATTRGFMLGPRLEEARAAGACAQEAHLYERNLRMQLTVWGTSDAGGSEVEDYANKEWAGLISTYYGPRWALWLARLKADLAQGRRYDPDAWRAESLDFTLRWAAAQQALPTRPQGCPMAISARMYQVYGPAWPSSSRVQPGGTEEDMIVVAIPDVLLAVPMAVPMES